MDDIIDIIKDEDTPLLDVSKSTINSFGYDLMRQEKHEDALRIFELNIELYPDDWYTYDSYGECLLEMGDVENGYKAYKKSLDLNPDNATAKEVLSEIK